jgi:cardiolipin synthase
MLRPQTPIAGAGDARIVGHVGLQDQNMKLAYLRAIDTAQTSIQIADPYMTDPGVLAHLITAAKQGVQVSLAFPKTNNKPSTQAAAEHYFPALLAAGVHITLYDGAPMAHSKIAIFDGRLVTIGTSNLDGRSLTYQDEDNVWTDDPAVAADLNQRYFVHDMAESQVVTSYHPTVKQSIENAFYAAAGNYL